MKRATTSMTALLLAMSAAALAGSLPACGGGDGPLFGTGGGSSDSTTTSSSSAGGGDASGGAGGAGGGTVEPPQHSWIECQASDQAFVRRALMALSGRRSWGQAEVNAYEDAIKAIRQADGMPGDMSDTVPVEWNDLVGARKLVAQAMMQENAFRERWSDFIMDALRVSRIEGKSQQSCYGEPLSSAFDDGALAAWVRDNDASQSSPPIASFTMGKLLSSSLALDDLSVVYRAHLFAMMSKPLTGANVDFLAMERNRRQDFGAIFDTAYIHRDMVCLGCHNSEFSVTYDADPAKNRAWPLPGLFEVALFGASNGKHPPEEEATKGPDDLRAHSMLRVADVVGGGLRPYGWSTACGTFSIPQNNDPLNVDTYFGDIRSTTQDPTKGLRASVWDLERSLRRGADKLAAHGLQRLSGNKLADADEAFAYLVAQNIVEKVWTEVMGTRLTIANYFPRTQVQRDIMMSLTEHFVATHFSLKTLLLDILAHPAFNLKAPEEGCGVSPYELPNLFDPWTVTENDPEKRPNSPGDGVFSISSRPLLRSLHRAMEWPMPTLYPNGSADQAFQVAIGFFIKDGEPGFRGLDFQGRLVWESAYGTCAKKAPTDFINKIVQQTAATPGATAGDAVIALKDRLVGEPWIEPTQEQPAIEALIGAKLSDVNVFNIEAKLRTLCGVLVSTPQFMLGGLPPKDTRDVPKLTPPDISYGATCNYVAGTLSAAGAPYAVTCGNGTTTATKK